jgi:hypothetical protein
MAEGIQYLNRLHHTVLEVVKANPSVEAIDLCKQVIEKLNLPLFMANPLVARSFVSSLKHLKT